MKKCFVISPIGDENTATRKRSDELLKYIIRPACQAENLECIRIDELSQSDTITVSILNELQTADLVIADITDHNPNCFYELGYRAALKKPLIQVKEQSTKLPFDISAIRTIDYDTHDLTKTDDTKNKLQETIRSFSLNDVGSSEDTSEDINETSTIEASQSAVNEKLDSIQQTLFHISDKIDKMKTDVESGVVSVMADKLQATGQKSAEQVFIEQMMGLLTDNPSQVANMIANVKQLEKLNQTNS